jgi:glycosyltransferase involved in cell wall biosynthesis
MEGFGLPPVEAMACGTPVVASHAGSLPEVVGEAGLFFEPTDVRAISACLRRIVVEAGLRAELGAKALRRASRFTWAASARAMLDAFEELGPGSVASARRRSA